MLPAIRTAFDGPSPHRRHLPWVRSSAWDETFERLGLEPDDDGPFELWPKEIAVQNRLEPMCALVSSLVASPETEELIERVLGGETSLDAAASKFVKRRGSRAWSTMREVLRRVIERRCAGAGYQRAVLALTSSSVVENAPLAPDELTRGRDGRQHPRQRGLAKRNREAAAILVARSASRCSRLTPRRTPSGGVEVSICHAKIADYRRGRYCLEHMPHLEHEKRQDRADREAVATLLHGVADALRAAA